jgi:hypothetical protein
LRLFVQKGQLFGTLKSQFFGRNVVELTREVQVVTIEMEVGIETLVKGNTVIYFTGAEGVVQHLIAVRAGEVSVKVGVGCWMECEHDTPRRLMNVVVKYSVRAREPGHSVNSGTISNGFFNGSRPHTPPE